MPIYAYKCAACGFAKDVLQKVSDSPLTLCPSCGQEAFSKQVTAAGFQLKGSGWYVTDFRDGNKGKDKATAPSGAADASANGSGGDGAASGAESTKAETPKSDSAAPKKADGATPAAVTPAAPSSAA